MESLEKGLGGVPRASYLQVTLIAMISGFMLHTSICWWFYGEIYRNHGAGDNSSDGAIVRSSLLFAFISTLVLLHSLFPGFRHPCEHGSCCGLVGMLRFLRRGDPSLSDEEFTSGNGSDGGEGNADAAAERRRAARRSVSIDVVPPERYRIEKVDRYLITSEIRRLTATSFYMRSVPLGILAILHLGQVKELQIAPFLVILFSCANVALYLYSTPWKLNKYHMYSLRIIRAAYLSSRGGVAPADLLDFAEVVCSDEMNLLTNIASRSTFESQWSEEVFAWLLRYLRIGEKERALCEVLENRLFELYRIAFPASEPSESSANEILSVATGKGGILDSYFDSVSDSGSQQTANSSVTEHARAGSMRSMSSAVTNGSGGAEGEVRRR